jgi:hypothetical protein
VNLRTRFEAEVRKDGWRRLIADIRGLWLVGTVFTLLIVCLVFMSSPRTSLEPVEGTLLGVHQSQSQTGRGALYATVQLTAGPLVTVPLPEAAPIRVGQRVRLHVSERKWPPRRTIYRFDQYVTP